MNKPKVPAFRFSDISVEVPMKPEWRHASSNKNDEHEIVETDLMTLGMIAYVHPESMEKYYETQNLKYMQSCSRIVFSTDRKTKETEGFIMAQMPNPEFLEKSNFKPFKKTSYLNRDKDFGGWIVFHNLDGSFSNGWVYENGKITGSIGHFDIGDIGLNLRSGEDCYSIHWYFNTWICPIWYLGGEYEFYCTLEDQTYLGTTTYCYGTPGGSGNGGYTGGTNGGGGNSSSTPQPREDCPGSATSNSAVTNNVLNSTYGTNNQVKSNIDLLRNYAKYNTNEFALAIDKDGNQYKVFDQNNDPNNSLYIKEGAADSVGYSYNTNTYMICHTHPQDSNTGYTTNTAPSPKDVISLATAYKGVASNITASVIFGHDGSEYMIYVNNRSDLSTFCGKPINSNFFENNGAYFKANSIFEEYYNNAHTSLVNKGFSDNDAQSYALSYVLDWFQTGLKISKKEPGQTDFKEQKTDYTPSGSNIIFTPTICQ